MRFEGTERIAASQPKVWAFLMDPQQVGSCGPGVESVEPVDATHFKARATVGVGFIKTRFVVDMEMADLHEPDSATMKAHGQALKAIDRIIRADGNPADVIAPANRIAENAAQLPSLFPTGSGPAKNPGKTEAAGAIWQQFDDFSAKAANLQAV